MTKKGERQGPWKKGGEERETRRGGTGPSQVALDQSQGLAHSSATFPVND